MFKLTNENYYSLDANKEYMSASQYKDFLKCEAYAMAKIKGEWVDETTDALLIGQYVDAYFSGEFDDFRKQHPEIFNSRTGELKSQFAKADELIEIIKNDPMMYAYLTGKHQVIYVGEIAGVPFKAKFDSDFDDKIVDGKVMKDTQPIWVENDFGRYTKTNFMKAYGYDIQGAIYQELKRQRINKTVPFILNIITKEKVPQKVLTRIDDDDLALVLEDIKVKAPRFEDIKLGLEKPNYCGKCDYCKSVLKVNSITSWHEFDPSDNSIAEDE